MLRKGSILVGLLLATTLGCYSAPVIPPVGYVYSNYDAPLDIDSDPTDMVGLSKGETTSFSVLGLVAWGDASTASAAKNGNLKTVNHVDYHYWSILGVYQKFTIKAYGKE